MPNKEEILKHTDKLLATATGAGEDPNIISEGYYGTLQLLRLVHGGESVQQEQLEQAMDEAGKAKAARFHNLNQFVTPAVIGSLKALKAEVEADLIGSVAMRASGETLGDFLGLAKEALSDGGDAQKNVAAVLVAAAFEDTLRRLAAEKAGLTLRPKLEEVIGTLKMAGILAGASVPAALSFLKFRNDSLHADWAQLKPDVIGGCLAFVEGLLLQHFS